MDTEWATVCHVIIDPSTPAPDFDAFSYLNKYEKTLSTNTIY